jgi:hypothetical protein
MREDYTARRVSGLVMGEVPYSKGAAYLIYNWRLTPDGLLDSTFRIMPMVPNEWAEDNQPPDPFGLVYAMSSFRLLNMPQMVFVTKDGIFKLKPGSRAGGTTYAGLDELKQMALDGSEVSVKPVAKPRYPPTMRQVGNRVYITLCDGGELWVWTGERLRPFGFTRQPSAPRAQGPQRETGATEYAGMNNGGFSPAGRIGTTHGDWTDTTGLVVGGIDDGAWRYGAVFEGPDGGYSSTSAHGGMVTIRRRLATGIPDGPDKLRKRVRVMDIPDGPPDTAAVLLLRTRNLERLPGSDQGRLRFLHRIPNGITREYIDDIPDGELGPEWNDRLTTPMGVYFIESYGGSLWLLRTDGHPARVWFSEQTSVLGPTPESILAGGWVDVFPDTGEIVGAVTVNIAGQQAAMLVFKRSAVHIIAGRYPSWETGTLHAAAGCEGPKLAQSLPDGSVLWYGGRTFWRLLPTGEVLDIGEDIRRTLQRVNDRQARWGHSWVDRRAQQAHFILPVDDEQVPSFQFVFDYRFGGWRLEQTVAATASCVMPGSDLVLVAGLWDDTKTVFALGRSCPAFPVDPPLAIYRTGWWAWNDPGPGAHAAIALRQLVLTQEERSDGAGTLRGYREWDLDAPVVGADADVPVEAYNPEAEGVPYWDAAVYGADVWRDLRVFAVRHPIDVPSAGVIAVEIQTTAHIAFAAIDAFGPTIARPGARTPTASEDAF